VRKPSADVCSYCFKFFNVRSTLNNYNTTATTTGNAANDDEQEQEKEADVDDTTPSVCVGTNQPSQRETPTNVDTPSNLTKNTKDCEDSGDVSVDKVALEWERRILEASIHVRRARVQRALANQKIEIAKVHQQQNVPHSERTYTFLYS
jgi:hypothetical protein